MTGVVALLLLVGGAGLVAIEQQQCRGSIRRLNQVNRKLRETAAATPSPSLENAARIETELERLRAAAENLRAQLEPGTASAALAGWGPPRGRSEAFFEIAGFVETMRARLQEHGVKFRADERFGFSDYAKDGPEKEQIASVSREVALVGKLLETWCETAGGQLLGVQRARPNRPGSVRARKPALLPANGETADYFTLDRRLSLESTGAIDTAAFRLAWIGDTPGLRRLLTAFSSGEGPWFVRAVEAEPEESGPKPASASMAPGSVVVRSGRMRFAIVIETVELPGNLGRRRTGS